MGRCSCSGATACSCVVIGGDGINVRGQGSGGNPYVIESTAQIERYIKTFDTPTVDLTLEGGGTSANPFILSGEATVRVTDLLDIGDGQTPDNGDTLVWVVDHFEFQPPPGSSDADGNPVISTGPGVLGSGSGADPLRAALSGTWGSGSMTGFPADKTLGVPVYADNAGQLRARPTPIVRYAVNPLGSYGSGWKAGSGTVFWYQQGALVYVRCVVTRSGSSISVGSGNDGNIANQEIGTLAAGMPTPLAGEWPAMVSGTGIALGDIYFDGNRKLMLAALPPNSKVTTDDNFSIVGVYWTGDAQVVL